jgi:hypothetical protein
MKLSTIIPPTPGDLADWSDVSELQARMIEAMRAMSNLGNEVGVARTIREYNSDRRKQALARAMRPALAGGESAAKAEMEARASEEYAKELTALERQLTAAEQTLTLYENHKLAWSTAQSLLAMQREGIKHI